MVDAGVCRNCRQVVSVSRIGAGGIRPRCGTRRMVDAATRWPSLSNSPWILWYPQLGFSLTMRLISSVTAAETGGRPRRCGYVHFLATRRRCQRGIVPGVTKRCPRSICGNLETSAARIARSAQSRRGLEFALRKTATSWRSTRSSTSLDADERPTNNNSRFSSRRKTR
jgi:hypothetical protein